MPYQDISDLPKGMKNNLPKHAQAIYKEAFNNALSQYSNKSARRSSADREVLTHKVAWSAVKHKYHKEDDNKWHAK